MASNNNNNNNSRIQQARQMVTGAVRAGVRTSSVGATEGIALPQGPPPSRGTRRAASRGAGTATSSDAASAAARPSSQRGSAAGDLGPQPALFAAPPAPRAGPVALNDEASRIIREKDIKDVNDPQRVVEYAVDIFASDLERETLFQAKATYMDMQADINPKMRAILLDWLVEVHMKYRMRPETLFLTINIIDRYLSVKPIMRKKLQLLGVVALLIASKYEEIEPPRAHEFVYITDKTYSKREVLDMEARVLHALDFQVTVPTQAHFLEGLQRANGCDALHRSLSQYVLELFVLDVRCLRYSPSHLVCSALYLSNTLLGKMAWGPQMVACSRHQEAAVAACAEEMRSVMEKPLAQSQAVKRKYQLDSNYAVADFSLSAISSASAARGGA